MDEEYHGEINDVVARYGVERVDAKMEIVCYHVNNIYEEMITVYCLNRYAYRILCVRILWERSVDDGIAEL